MTGPPHHGDRPGAEEGHLVRPYAITGGRTRPSRSDFTLITLVVTRDPGAGTDRLDPEPAAIVELCRDRAMAVAEIAGRLDLPVSVVKVLLGDLVDSGTVLVRAPMQVDTPDIRLLQAVIEGVRRL
ncbi:DUF742 domain-containing protein [Streptomyces sp. NPDC059506]|uniref:DUF742 domain-containing protein n=1 Tax=Streptomyces thermolineatus TaxID=44033 RepID=A0ABN3KQK3_9ACTN|nr:MULTISPECIES: DUF742 domain-containing protein [unclassified Streptomyces]MCZ2523339.1 DUF742 domain-containing protein [Streptomyces sp. HB2AG]PLW66644.1 hypothetical protein C0036_21900 [Streptomyces sp. DJ]QMV23294.1 DUF742 domain-containing protein [Streptomyces sp. SCUT-3]